MSDTTGGPKSARTGHDRIVGRAADHLRHHFADGIVVFVARDMIPNIGMWPPVPRCGAQALGGGMGDMR